MKSLDIRAFRAYDTNMCSGLAALVERAEDAAAASSVEGRLLLLAGLRQAVDAAMVAALGEIAAAPGPVQLDGGIDGGQWLAARSELHPAEARALGGLAGDLPAMPVTAEALSNGRIGVEKARLLGTARDVNGFAEAEAGLVDAVIGVSLRRARRVIGRFVADYQEVDPADPAANEVTLAPKRNGRWGLHGDLDAETATLIANELRRLADGHRDDEGLNLGRRRALGLLDMARRSVSFGERGPGSRPEVVLVADVRFDGDIVDARYEDGTPVSRKVFENLACDATVRALVVNGPSEPLELGRSQRLATAGQRRAAAVRDGGCVYPDCDQPPDHCDLHHIRHWLNGGKTDLPNLCLLCRRHHALAHLIGFTFAGDKHGQLIIYRPDGEPLHWFRQRAA